MEQKESPQYAAREGHKIGHDLREHHFHQAQHELVKELYAHPKQFNELLKSINQDLGHHHQHPLVIEHDHGKHISHINFAGNDIYNQSHEHVLTSRREGAKSLVESARPGGVVVMPKSGAETTKPATDTTKPATDTTKPATDTTKPATDTTKPATDTTKPATDTTKPATDTTKPATDTTKPATDTTKPATDTTKPGNDAAKGDAAKGDPSIRDLKTKLADEAALAIASMDHPATSITKDQLRTVAETYNSLAYDRAGAADGDQMRKYWDQCRHLLDNWDTPAGKSLQDKNGEISLDKVKANDSQAEAAGILSNSLDSVSEGKPFPKNAWEKLDQVLRRAVQYEPQAELRQNRIDESLEEINAKMSGDGRVFVKLAGDGQAQIRLAQQAPQELLDKLNQAPDDAAKQELAKQKGFTYDEKEDAWLKDLVEPRRISLNETDAPTDVAAPPKTQPAATDTAVLPTDAAAPPKTQPAATDTAALPTDTAAPPKTQPAATDTAARPTGAAAPPTKDLTDESAKLAYEAKLAIKYLGVDTTNDDASKRDTTKEDPHTISKGQLEGLLSPLDPDSDVFKSGPANEQAQRDVEKAQLKDLLDHWDDAAAKQLEYGGKISQYTADESLADSRFKLAQDAEVALTYAGRSSDKHPTISKDQLQAILQLLPRSDNAEVAATLQAEHAQIQHLVDHWNDPAAKQLQDNGVISQKSADANVHDLKTKLADEAKAAIDYLTDGSDTEKTISRDQLEKLRDSKPDSSDPESGKLHQYDDSNSPELQDYERQSRAKVQHLLANWDTATKSLGENGVVSLEQAEKNGSGSEAADFINKGLESVDQGKPFPQEAWDKFDQVLRDNFHNSANTEDANEIRKLSIAIQLNAINQQIPGDDGVFVELNGDKATIRLAQQAPQNMLQQLADAQGDNAATTKAQAALTSLGYVRSEVMSAEGENEYRWLKDRVKPREDVSLE